MTLGRGIGIQYISENHNVARLAAQLGPSLYDVDASVAVREHERLRARNLVVRFSGPGCSVILEEAGFLPKDGETLQIGSIPQRYTQSDLLRRSFLRGAFLGAGSVCDPRKAYHLEIVTKHERFAQELCMLMERCRLPAKATKRKGSYIVYLKESDKVGDFLRLVGASQSTIDFEDARMLRELSNNLNRQRNFEDANMQKAAQASAQQLVDIELIQKTQGLESLPAKLFEVAEARINHPEASLSELSALLNVSKSGLNHRFAKIAARADTLRLHDE